ncbi:trypsin-like serine protease [archaeon]|jgi:S1-C subfamily serine protease|nr:trypsin-like serine protease [archaeon]
MKKHHKIILGGFSSVLIIFMLAMSILTYTMFLRQNIEFAKINQDISTLEIETQIKLNELTDSMIQTRSDLTLIDSEVGSISNKIKTLKNEASEDFSEIIEDSIKAVVTVKTDIGQGTGFILSENGFLITNAHILAGGKSLTISNYLEENLPGQLIGYDTNYDIALIKISGIHEYLDLENSNNTQIGEKVIAIGNPLGLQFSVSEGIVSATKRTGILDEEIYIQTDAALNPGNSGGPLINKKGLAIGINNFKISETENLGFALESNKIKEIVNEIIKQELNQSLF